MIGRANFRVAGWLEVDVDGIVICLEAQWMFTLEVVDL